MKLLIRPLATVLLLFLATSCRTEAIYNVERAPLPQSGTLEQVKLDIERAAAIQDWRLEEVGPQTFIATKRFGQHTASTTVRYDEHSFSIALRQTRDLRESDGRVHKVYNRWVWALEQSIRRESAAR
jgi:hypothetical protein